MGGIILNKLPPFFIYDSEGKNVPFCSFFEQLKQLNFVFFCLNVYTVKKAIKNPYLLAWKTV